MECKICQSTETQVIQDTVRSVKGRVKCDVYRCRNCGVVFLDNRKSQSELNDYFRQEYWKDVPPVKDPLGYYKARMPIEKYRYDRLKEFFDKSSSVLDIGCASGSFMEFIKDKVKSVDGIEFSQPHVDFAKEHFGLKVKNISIEQLPDEPTYDVICLFQVLEHVDDPNKFIKEVFKRLKTNGVIILENQNISDPLISVFDLDAYKKFFFFEPLLYCFSEKSMSLLLEKNGFQDVKYKSYQHYGIINNLHWVFTGKTMNKTKASGSEANIPGCNEKVIGPFLKRINAEYKAYLEEHGLTDTILCVARKSKEQ